ncbi:MULTISPECIES: DUF4167 domain-containing protein [Donghicola]|jgi:hypothetical protein|uniref:DUF4167 domain-containing protein n=1 Tax=Donghicola sp. TaxID=1929294 RepID=UPI0025E4A9E0|nr:MULTISPECIES: DUF4167 domain-containing protein [Donghicola]MCI5039054.1 DUF4167 domain-containing protein [Donghicola eburneus]MCT4577287.1 DUF4167 domain-containing protein [Donghicola sp.]
MRSSKSRSRSKSNRNNRSMGNIVNRVFDSSGPEGKVRGTPQQIIEKYNQLARDAQLSNDRVAAENFQQHAEHYLRMLSEAQREIDARREQQEREMRERQAEKDRERAERQERRERENAESGNDQQPETQSEDAAPVATEAAPEQTQSEGLTVEAEADSDDADNGLVETPESKASEAQPAAEEPKPARKPRAPRAKKPAADKAEGEEKPKPKRAPRKPRAKKADTEGGDAPKGDSSSDTPAAAE